MLNYLLTLDLNLALRRSDNITDIHLDKRESKLNILHEPTDKGKKRDLM